MIANKKMLYQSKVANLYQTYFCKKIYVDPKLYSKFDPLIFGDKLK